MRRTLIPLTAAAMAVLILAGIVVAAGPRSGTAPGTTSAGAAGSGAGIAAMRGRGRGSSAAPATAVTTLTVTQQAELARMAEDEKLAGDLYEVLAAQFGSVEIANIARSEDVHLTRVRTLLARYGVADPTAGLAAGEFATPAIQDLFDTLLTQGSASLDAAYAVGVTVEETDIADLVTARADGVLPSDVGRVYTNLQRASGNHLASFRALLAA